MEILEQLLKPVKCNTADWDIKNSGGTRMLYRTVNMEMLTSNRSLFNKMEIHRITSVDGKYEQPVIMTRGPYSLTVS